MATKPNFVFADVPERPKTNSITVKRQRLIEGLIKQAAEVKRFDPFTGKAHTLYSLQHTAICMRIVNSHGKVNIFNLVKNAGTSVEQIERFYAKHLPLSKELARNLQSFGED